MTEQIKNDVNKILNLPQPLFDEFWIRLKPLSILKGAFFLSEGDFCTSIALVLKGAFYSYYQKEGNEIIEGFCLEGCFMADYPSFINRIPSKKNFRAIENTQLLIVSKDELEKLYGTDPLFEKAGRLMAEYLFTQWELKLRDTIFLSPLERYKKLLSDRRNVLQRVPQYHIASFLNITPQYLSQIRRKITSETS
jgi:CRP-like cAMP-binding protein